MFSTSKDIFLIVAAFCLLWLTFFITWALYYIVQMLREAYGIFEDMKRRMELIDRFLSVVTEKFEHSASAFQVLVKGFMELASYLQERKTTSKRRRKDEE